MPFLPAFLLLAQGVAQAQIDVPIRHVRPSKIMRYLATLGSDEKVFFLPNDVESTLRLVGPRDDVEAMRTTVGLFDNLPRKIRLEVRIESPLNHRDWKGQIEGTNNEPWTGDDGATDVKLRVVPRLNDDNTCTLFVEAKSPDATPMSVVFRVKLGEEMSFEMKAFGIRPESMKPNWVPKFSVKYLGD